MPFDSPNFPVLQRKEIVFTQEPELEQGEDNLLLMLHNLHKEHLDKFPKTGKDYFTYPSPSEQMQQFYEKVNDQQVGQLVKSWLSLDVTNRQDMQSYDQRTLGFMLRSLIDSRGEAVLKAIACNLPQDHTSYERWYRQYAVLYYSESKHDGSSNLADILDDDRKTGGTLFSPEQVPDHIDRLIDTKTLDRQTQVYLMRLGILIDGEDYKSDVIENFIHFHHGGKEDLPMLEAIIDDASPINLEKDDNDYQTKIDICKLSCIEIQLKEGMEIDKEMLDSLLVNEEISPISCVFTLSMYDRSQADLPSEIQIVGTNEQDQYPQEIIDFVLKDAIVFEKEIHPQSTLARVIAQSVSVNPDELIKYVLDTYQGDWLRLKPEIRSYLERSVAEYGISWNGILKICSSAIGQGIELPDFIADKINSRDFIVLVDTYGFDLSERTEANLWAVEQRYTHNPNHQFYNQGFAAFPQSIRETMQAGLNKPENSKALAKQIFKQLYVYNTYYQDYLLDSHLPLPNDGQYWQLLHPDILKIMDSMDYEDIYGELNHIYSNSILVGYYNSDQESHFQSKDVTISEILPPNLIKKIQEGLLTLDFNSSGSLDKLDKMVFAANPELLARFGYIERQIVSQYMKDKITARNLRNFLEPLLSDQDTYFTTLEDGRKIVNQTGLELLAINDRNNNYSSTPYPDRLLAGLPILMECGLIDFEQEAVFNEAESAYWKLYQSNDGKAVAGLYHIKDERTWKYTGIDLDKFAHDIDITSGTLRIGLTKYQELFADNVVPSPLEIFEKAGLVDREYLINQLCDEIISQTQLNSSWDEKDSIKQIAALWQKLKAEQIETTQHSQLRNKFIHALETI